MATHTYWRINITANNGNASSQKTGIMEVEMRATVGGADQCTGGTPSASSENSGFEASKAFDNNATTTQWLSNASEPSAPWWLKYQFASAVDVAEVSIVPPTTLTRAPKDFDIQYSDDNSAWTTWLAVTNVTDWATNTAKLFSLPATNQGKFFALL
jgi:hypothetical protein